jgi:hypothetical protein
MKGADKIDFGPLDPSRDAQRWQRMVSSVAERAFARRRLPRSIPLQLLSWARPTLAVAAALALLVWVGALFGKPTRPPTIELDQALTQAQAQGDVLAAERLMLALGDADGDR